MDSGRSGMQTENLDTIIPRRDVTESKSETESVTIERLKHETIRFITVAVVSGVIILAVVGFLILSYGNATDETKGRIITAMLSVLSGAVGVFVGKKV